MNNTSDLVIELNWFARGICLDRRAAAIASDTPPEDIVATARRSLLNYWREDGIRDLVPARPEPPDEVVVRGADGRALYRRTIIDEKIERLFANM
ncbi:MAG TPA: hypothetical protein VKX28_28100 [Xanthobacteraceae bacterium]|jgi:hypothetical protein|nr:hypothetical protein [Xanthobacteraceae bacterium]